MKKEFKIGSRFIGQGHPAYIIAEMSANHAGSMERAKEIIRAAKESGADCIKIQTYTPDTITIDCHNEYFQIEKGTWEGENLYSLYGKAYTPWEWQAELKAEADKVGIDFLSTPFDKTAVDFLEEIGLEFYKIASFELVDIPLISYVASKGKPVIMSTGMATMEEIEEAVEAVKAAGGEELVVMKCSSAYPAVPEDMHLRTISDLQEKLDLPIGLSDHSMGSMSAATAVALGACVIEKHFCLGREIENPDSSFSMNPEEFAQMVREIRCVEAALGKPTYGVCKQEETNLGFRRSLFVVKDIAAGEPFTEENVRSIRPANGLKPIFMQDILGLTAGKDLSFGTPLTFDALEKGAEIFLTEDEQVRSLCESRRKEGIKAYCIRNRVTAEMLAMAEPAGVFVCNYRYPVSEEFLTSLKGKVKIYDTVVDLETGLRK
ncbi:MAG: pseudaminic acid synthase [Lachnospiraceae bacterium]|nr:pseudaminic acid synthase [Lachnospiraceae bacterium]